MMNAILYIPAPLSRVIRKRHQLFSIFICDQSKVMQSKILLNNMTEQ